jgi:cytochrome b
MSRLLIWDVPTRLFHWLLAAGFLAAAFISLVLGDESPLFPWHAILGLTIGVMLAMRLLWGFVGTKYARFGSFAFGPAALTEYAKGALRGGGKRYVGHNPGSAYAVYAMLALLVGLAVTGFMLGRGNESVKDTHELLAYGMLAVVGLHIAGIAFHTLRHRENIAASMIHGHRPGVEGEVGIRSARPLVGLLFLGVTGAWFGWIVSTYDAASQSVRVPLLGVSLQLGETEETEDEDHGERGEHERGGDDD